MNGCYDGFGTKWKKFLGFPNRRPDCNWLPGAIPEPNWPGFFFSHPRNHHETSACGSALASKSYFGAVGAVRLRVWKLFG